MRKRVTGARAARRPSSPRPPRTSARLKAEIEERVGFFPPFFDPALGIPEVLDNLWQQTLSAYLHNPLPAAFKDKLFARLARSSALPYAIVTHSCVLRPLSMRPEEILQLLDGEPLLAEVAPATELESLLRASPPFQSWPEASSPLEEALLASATRLFLEPERAEGAAAQLRRLLGPPHYANLVALLAYVRTCLAWAEAHPELSREADVRVTTNLQPLLSAEPQLAEFFRTYPERLRRAREATAPRPSAARPADAEDRFRQVFDDAPLAMALLGRDLTLLRVNGAFSGLLGYERADLLGQSLLALTRPGGAGPLQAQQLFEDQTAPRRTQQRSLTLVKRGGETSEGALTLTAIRDSDGVPLYALAIVEEILDRDTVEQALREAKERLAASADALERRDSQLRRFGEMSEPLEACVSADEIHSVIAKFGRELFPAQSGALYLLDDSHHLAASVASWGSASGSAEVFTADDCWALRRGRAHTVRNPEAGLLCAHLKIVPSGGYVCIPLLAAGGTLGVLHLRGDVAASAEPVQHFAAAFAEQLALALSNLTLRETLRIHALRDPLTALFNRRYLEEILERETQRARRHERRLAVVMCDVDHFKRFNDTYGREAGDEVLRTFGAFLQAHVRSEDWACRYGGAEFAVVMPEASAAGAQLWAERLNDRVKRMEVSHWGRLLPAIALSLGVVANDDTKLNGSDLLQLADEAVRRAKENGRDQVFVATTGG